METDYVLVGDICRNRMGQQCQYGARYLDPLCAPDGQYVGSGLRIIGACSDYHQMRIHKDDVETFIQRWEDCTGCKRLK